MAKLTRQIDGTYLTEDNKNVGDLDMAYSRGNPTDVANVQYAQDKYGYTPKTNTAGANTGLETQTNLPTTPSLVPAGVPEPTEEADIFNLLTRDALLKFQGVNTADLEKKKRALQMTAIGKQSEITPEDLRTFSPEQQASIRSGNITALQPEFDEVSYQLNKAQQATANFESVYEKVMAISQDYAAKMVAPDSVIENYKKLIEADPENINTYLANVNDKTRDAILQSLDYSKLKPKSELEIYEEKLKLDQQYKGTDDEESTSDYKNWILAGGLSGTGKTFAQWLTKNDGGRPLTPAQTNLISEGKQLQLVLDPLYKTIEDNKNAFGPISGFFGSANPYNTNAQTIDAEMRRAAQTIGKYMEGGVLRKEDEIKYRKMLPQLTDTTAVANNKLAGVKELLEGKIKSYINDYATAGFDVSQFTGQGNGSTNTEIKDFNYYKELYPNAPDEEIQSLLEQYSFNSVGGDTKLATIALSIPDGEKGGQCGRFVNNLTGLGVGDSYQSKLSKMDPNINYPLPGMVFTMPLTGELAKYGHTGIIVDVQGNNAIVKDSNWSKDEKIKTHTIPIDKMTGFALV